MNCKTVPAKRHTRLLSRRRYNGLRYDARLHRPAGAPLRCVLGAADPFFPACSPVSRLTRGCAQAWPAAACRRPPPAPCARRCALPPSPGARFGSAEASPGFAPLSRLRARAPARLLQRQADLRQQLAAQGPDRPGHQLPGLDRCARSMPQRARARAHATRRAPVPSNIPVSGFAGKSLFGLLMGSIGSNLVRSCAAPRFALTRPRRALLPPWRCARTLRAAQPRRLAIPLRCALLQRRIGPQRRATAARVHRALALSPRQLVCAAC